MEISFSSKRDVYLEIAARYETYITLGVLRAGEKLPSVREAAGELRVNPNTVQRAYSLLEERGLIRSVPKKGAFVIFGREADEAREALGALTAELLRLKEMGVSREAILSAIEEVYPHD